MQQHLVRRGGDLLDPDDAQSEADAVEDPLVMEEEFVVNHEIR